MKTIFSILVTALFMSSSNHAIALNFPGFVNSYVSSGYTYVYGTYNVGTNPRVGHENSYMKFDTASVNLAFITAYDAVNNRTVVCDNQSIDSDVLKMIKKLGASINDGAYVYFRVNATGSCEYVYISKTSFYQR